MTRRNEKLTSEKKLVVVFDICSSTTILEDLKRTDNLAAWRDLLISLKQCLRREGSRLQLEIYKFIGDGWVLLFPRATAKGKLCALLRKLSERFDHEFTQSISPLLSQPPNPVGLMFGIDAGELIRLKMNEQTEYLGRAINVAARLQSATKDLPDGPSYTALFSNNALNSPKPRSAGLAFERRTVSLRNISPPSMECFLFHTRGRPRREGRGPLNTTPSRAPTSDRNGGEVSSSTRAGHLEMVFVPGRKPYFEEQPTRALPAGLLVDRRYRVGIRNTGGATISGARVILENCEPCESDGIHLGHALQVMGQPSGPGGDFSVPPGDVPSVFVDVAFDETVSSRPHGNAFGLCYVAPVPSNAIPRGSYVLTLRLEGCGSPTRKKFKIIQDPTTTLLKMHELASNDVPVKMARPVRTRATERGPGA